MLLLGCTVALILCAISCYAWYLRKCFAYWRNGGVASTSPKSFLGDVGSALLGRRHIAHVYDAIYNAFPDEKFVGMYDLVAPSLLVRDPRMLETIMVKDFSHFHDRVSSDKKSSRLDYNLFLLKGEEWKAVRTKLVATFTASKLKGMIPMIDYCARIFDTHLRNEAEAGVMVDMKEMAARFATDVIGCCMFGLHFNTLDDPESEYRKIGKIMFTPKIRAAALFLLQLIAPKLLQFFNVSPNPPQMLPFFLKLLEQSEEFRREESTRRNDLMQLMLDIRDREQIDDKECPDGTLFNDNVILSNTFIFYVAGFETTSSTLSYCLYELALHPQVQQRLREEIKSVEINDGEEVKYETLKRLTYMDMVLSETTRKYAPAPFLNRVCTVPYKLPGTSATLKPGTRIVIPVYSLHRDEKYFPEPNKFDPERFTAENIEARPSFTFLPFGDGPRMCIAARFAEMEIKLCLAHLLVKYEFGVCAKTEIPLKIHPRSFLMIPKNGVHLKVKRIDQKI